MSNIFENINTICFTGPRPAKLYGYTKKEEYQKIVNQLKEIIRGFAKFGIKNYITGGAQGFDQLAFWAVNSLKVPYGDWIVEHHTVVNDEDILKVFLKEPGDHFDRTWSNIKITNIKWDTSEDAKVWAKLPDEVDVLDMDIDLSKYDPSKDLDYDDEFLDDVSEWLTSHYDFCHDGFDIVTK